jgi:hypothetical protein
MTPYGHRMVTNMLQPFACAEDRQALAREFTEAATAQPRLLLPRPVLVVDSDGAKLNDESEFIFAKETIYICQKPQGPPVTHSDDYRSVVWHGVPYSFTPAQAACVKPLWAAWESGAAELGQEKILESWNYRKDSEAGTYQTRLVDLFRGHKAWGVMIVPGGSKGSYRLNPLNPNPKK